MQIQRLCRYLTGESGTKRGIPEPTQAQAARRLGVSEASLSRFLSGKSVPALEILERIYTYARADANDGFPVDVTRAKLRKLRERANADHCHGCVALRAELENMRTARDAQATDTHAKGGSTEGAGQTSLQEQQLRLRFHAMEAERDEMARQRDHRRQGCDRHTAEIDRLSNEIARLRLLVLRSASRAGSGSSPAAAATGEAGPLPVPRGTGDRQRSSADEHAAWNVAAKADALQASSRQGAALPLLHHTAHRFSHAEVAALLCLLRHQQERELADNLIHIYGRDRSHQDVVRVALELHERGAPGDAGALLRLRAAF
ncbi:helix-turn-helix transcriptional regulator [Streptomyces sp. BK239]|uniref:helix-turn-helix domain-containing protein n=1 Tax=Streptomyces sp. BK239 TaxID=2512155 RepID=UPI0013EF4595|nr:helix-turn-helix transcriptional regulator [Streptomyces sp. BK239]